MSRFSEAPLPLPPASARTRRQLAQMMEEGIRRPADPALTDRLETGAVRVSEIHAQGVTSRSAV